MFLRSVFAACALLISSHAAAAELEAYSRLPAVSDFDISDDGQNIAFVATREGQQTVVVQSLSSGDILQMASLGDAKIRAVSWAGPDYVLITASTTGSVEYLTLRGELYQGVALNVRTGHSAQLISRVRRGDNYLNILWSYPVAGVWEGQPVAFVEAMFGRPFSTEWRVDLLRINLRDGAATLHQRGGMETDGFFVTRTGEVLAESRYYREMGRWVLSMHQGGGWRTVMQVDDAQIDRPYVAGLTSDGAGLIVSRRDPATEDWRFVPIDLQTGAEQAPLDVPVDTGLILDHQRRAMGYGSTSHFTNYTFFNPQQDQTWTQLSAVLNGRQVMLSDWTPDFSRLIAYAQGTGTPGNYYMFEPAARRLVQIGRAYPNLTERDVAEVRSITYAAGDGLQIQAYLTLPPGRAATGLPLIVMPHGGPQARDYAGFDWMAQALASRGYAVLQPNFRGSEGFGEDFVEAGYGEWGRKMQTDLSDGITYLAGRGMVDPARVCIMGGSYGGYAALAGVTLQSGVYRCAVSIAGVSDVQEMIHNMVIGGSQHDPRYRYWTRYLGVQDYSDPRLQEISPRRAAGNGNAPVLLIHGRDDTVVDYSQSTAMRQALQAAGRPVEFVELREEDHWLSREPTRIQTIEAAVAFIERHNPPN